MGAPFHGYNALIYVGGAEIVGGNAWSISVDATAVETPQFGQKHTVQVAGPYTWNGSISAWDQSDETTLISAAIGAASVALLLYPDRADTASYWSGSIIVSGGHSGGTRSAVDHNGTFVGATALTKNGFT